jgi:hypothetical protein
LASELFRREMLTYDDVQQLIGVPPHGQKSVIEMSNTRLILPEPETTDEKATNSPGEMPRQPRDE